MKELKRILLVEDNANDVELALEALSAQNLADDIVVVRDGQEALDYLYATGAWAERPAGQPAVVLLDLKLPRVDGLEVLQRVKSDPHLRCVPIVMLTSSREEVDLVASYHLGVNAYVVKPIEFPEFIATLRQLGLFWTTVNQPPPAAR